MGTDPQQATAVADIDLRALAEHTGVERAVVSLYVSGPESLRQIEQKADRVRFFLSDLPIEREHFDRSFERIVEWLDDNAPQDFEGLVVFASWALDFASGWVLPLDVPDVLRIETSPYLRPLAELQDEYETFVVVAADNDATRLFVVTSARIEEQERVSGGVKNRVKKGGWSQKRYARRRLKELEQYAADVVDRLETLCSEHDVRRIVLLGSQETLLEIRDALPTPLADKLVAEEPADLDDSRSELVEQGLEQFFEAERSDEQQLWDSIRENGLSNDLAALGATDVLAAAAVGRVEEILVTRDAKVSGTRCRDCENVVHGTPDACQICGSKSVFEVDLVEELVRLAETTGATVDFADPIDGLTEAGDVAALLRY